MNASSNESNGIEWRKKNININNSECMGLL